MQPVTVHDDLKAQVKEIVANAIDLETGDFNDDEDVFEKLGISSVVAFEIIIKIQKTFLITISDDEIIKVRSVNNICGLIESHLKTM